MVTKKWELIVASLRNSTREIDCPDVSLEEVLAAESELLKDMEGDSKPYRIVSSHVNPNEKYIDSSYMNTVALYADVLEAFSSYVNSSNEGSADGLLDISKDTERFNGKFRGGVKRFLMAPEMDSPRPKLSIYQKDNFEPLHRLALGDYEPEITEPERKEFRQNVEKVLQHDHVFRAKYKAAIADVRRWADTVKTSQDRSMADCYFKDATSICR